MDRSAMLRCPTCQKPVSEPPPGQPMGAFPFCSDRCRLIDLGRWLDGKYQIPAVEDTSEDGDFTPRRPPVGSDDGDDLLR